MRYNSYFKWYEQTRKVIQKILQKLIQELLSLSKKITISRQKFNKLK